MTFRIVKRQSAIYFKSSLHLYLEPENCPRYDKTNNVAVRPAKTHIGLGIRPVWSEPSLCAQWVAKDPSFLHADSEDSDLSLRWAHNHLVGFVMSLLIYIKSQKMG